MSRSNETAKDKAEVDSMEETLNAWNAYRGANMAERYYGIIANHLPTFGGMDLVEETHMNYLYSGTNGYQLSIFKARELQLRQVKVVPSMCPNLSAWTFFLDLNNKISLVMKCDIGSEFEWTTSSVEDFEAFDTEYKRLVQILENSFLMSSTRNSETSNKLVV
jgi:hypothetical protein